MDLQSILKRFTEIKLEEDVLRERFREIEAEKCRLLNQLREVNKGDINRRMDELLPYYLEYEFLQKNLKEFEEIDGITDKYTEVNTDKVNENNEDKRAEEIDTENDVFLEEENITYENTVDDMANVPTKKEDYDKQIETVEETEYTTENKTDISELKEEDNTTDNNELENRELNSDTNEEEVTEEESNSNEDLINAKDDSDEEIEADDTTLNVENHTDDNEEVEIQNEGQQKHKRHFKDLTLEEKKQYLISISNSYQDKVKEIMEFWAKKEDIDQRNRGLVILRDIRLAKEKIYSEELGSLKEDVDFDVINEVMSSLRNTKENIETYDFEKEKEEIKEKY
ncbi:hypothetical protein [Peptoniphilus harei]|uniref:Uncharacterized protein n=1 Tax=Peptoniphilus harei TaxID=54005 RepID=A0A943SQN9_9FIRM|nr:hypothetical protein [Peptoniphilus harei]MBS6535371.1 hypothetical protein [Peptoniphilus harei]